MIQDRNKYYFEKNHVRKEIKDIEFIRKICKATNDKWHHRYGFDFIKIGKDIYGYGDFGSIKVLEKIEGEFLKEMKRAGMTFKNDDLDIGTDEVIDGQIKFII